MEIVEKKETNADRIRNMSDEELARFIHNISVYSEDEEPIIDVCIGETHTTLYNDYGDILEWLQSEAGVIELKDETEIVKQGGVSDDVCEWNKSKDYPFDWIVGCDGCEVNHRQGDYCPRCGKKIKAVE